MPPWKILTRQKDPDEDIDFSFDWDTLLFRGTDTIKSSTWFSSVPAELVVHDDTFISDPAKTQTWVSGGILGTTYLLTNRITSNNDPERKLDRSIYIKMETM